MNKQINKTVYFRERRFTGELVSSHPSHPPLPTKYKQFHNDDVEILRSMSLIGRFSLLNFSRVTTINPVSINFPK